MKFLQLYCLKRNTNVFINPERIIMISASTSHGNSTPHCFIELEGLDDGAGAVEVQKSAGELARLISGQDKTSVGFRTGGV